MSTNWQDVPFYQALAAAVLSVSGMTGISFLFDTNYIEDRLRYEVAALCEDKVKNTVEREVTANLNTLKYDLFFKLDEVSHMIPPEPLRERVLALEREMRRTNPEYHPPTTKWK